MDFIQVEIAIAIAKHHSFSEAAWETSVSPSTVTKQLAALEKELDIRLFERKARSKVTLTSAGEKVMPYLEKILDDYNQLRAQISSTIHNTGIRLACPKGFSTLGEDEIISLFYEKNPGLTVSQQYGSAQFCQALLEEDKADLTIRMLSPKDIEKFTGTQKDFGIMKICENHLIMAIRSDHPEIQNGVVDLKKLSNETFIFRAFNSDMQHDDKTGAFRDACIKEGFTPKLEFQTDMRPSTVFALAAKGLGIVPMMHKPNIEYSGVSYVPLSKDYYSFITVLIYKKSNHLPALKRFLECAKCYRRELNKI